MSTLLSLAFHCLLRIGEALQITAFDFALGERHGICSLKGTKSGKRNAADEAISITDPITLESIRSLIMLRGEQGVLELPLWSGTGTAFRKRFAALCQLYHISHHNFRPYSLGRGGATHLFQQTRSTEQALLRGRWESSRVARIHISDAVSYLPSIRIAHDTKLMLQQHVYLSPQSS